MAQAVGHAAEARQLAEAAANLNRKATALAEAAASLRSLAAANAQAARRITERGAP